MTAGPFPLVTVFMPVYNHAAFVEASLDSVAQEDYPELELVIIDDGSTDDSFPRVQRWVDAHAGRFRRIICRTPPNAGLCRTLNRLVAEIQGSFATMLASDDALIPGGIRARVEALQQHPEWLAVFGDAQTMDGDSKVYQQSNLVEEQEANLKALQDPQRITMELLLRWSIPGPVLLCRREAWDTVLGVGPYDESLFLEDRDFYLRLLARQALGFENRPVARYRLHASNACRDPSARNRLRETLWKSNLKNAPLFAGPARRILLLQARERHAALLGHRFERLWAKLGLALFRLWFRPPQVFRP
jgi:glycosyltransferase involved in cell wall biosynthesis